MSAVPQAVVVKNEKGEPATHGVVMANTGPHTVMLGTLHCIIEKAYSFQTGPTPDLPLYVRPQTFKMAKKAMKVECGSLDATKAGGATFKFLSDEGLTEAGKGLTDGAKAKAEMKDGGCMLRVTITSSSSFSIWYSPEKFKVLLVIIVSDSFMVSPIINTEVNSTTEGQATPARVFSTDGISSLSAKMWLYFLASVFASVDFASYARENGIGKTGPAVYGSAHGERCGECGPCKNRALHKPCEKRAEREKVMRRSNLPGYKPSTSSSTPNVRPLAKTGTADIKSKQRAVQRKVRKGGGLAFSKGKRQAPVLLDDDNEDEDDKPVIVQQPPKRVKVNDT